jgi:hypothetical protein
MKKIVLNKPAATEKNSALMKQHHAAILLKVNDESLILIGPDFFPGCSCFLKIDIIIFSLLNIIGSFFWRKSN